MDPVTQGLFGALWSGSTARTSNLRPALLTGAIAGLAPDLDSLIHSSSDPLLELEFHRHFSHALLFTPVGALLVALILWPWLRHRQRFGQVYLWAFLGYLSHGFLDSFTSYGTSWLWPLSDERLAWDWMSIIDPVFSLPLAGLVAASCWRRSHRWAMAGLVLAAGYLLLGGWQQHQAAALQQQLIDERGQSATRQRVMPSLGNVLVWRSVYRHGDHWVVDALRVSPGSDALIWPGGRQAVFSVDSQPHAGSIRRYRHFTQDYLARGPDTADGRVVVSDVRYAPLPHVTRPLWALVLEPDGTVSDATHLKRESRLASRFWSMIQGEHCDLIRCERR